MNIKSPRAVVCGAGGFIGGHLVKGLSKRGVQVIRAVDIKPVEEWYQVTDGVENLSLDLMEKESCLISASGADHIYQLAANMGGMGFIESNKGPLHAERGGEYQHADGGPGSRSAKVLLCIVGLRL